MADIRNFFGNKCQLNSSNKIISNQGGGDTEESESEKRGKRKASQFNYDKNKRKRVIQKSWLDEYQWAKYEDDSNSLFCQVCLKYPSINDPDSSLVKGVRENFRKETLKFHNKSSKHIRCIEREKAENAAPGTSALHKSVQKAKIKNIEVYEKLFNTALYVALEGEPMTKFEKLCKLQEKNGISLGTNYKNNHACSDFVSSISETIKESNISSIENTRFISVLCDGATDKSIQEQEIVFVRYVDSSGKLTTQLAEIVALDHGHSRGVKDGVFKAFESVGLTAQQVSEKLIGINTDGASVNMGHKSGAVKLIIDDISEILERDSSKYVVVVHCIAHNLELAVCDAKKDCAYLKKFEEVLKGIFHFYYYSPKKRRELFEIASNLDQELKHFGGVQQIRWVASQNRALKALLDNYEITCVHLEEIAQRKDENAAKANGFLKEMKSDRFLRFLHFMIDWTNMLSDVSCIFQEKHCLVSQVCQRIEDMKEKFEYMKTRRGKHLRSYERNSADGNFKGVQVTQDARRGLLVEDYVADVNSDINELLSDSIYFLEERFIKHLGGEPHALFNVLNFSLWPNKETHPEQFRAFGVEQIESLVEIYSPLLTEEEIENASDQWLDLKLIVNRTKKTSILDTYESLLAIDRESDDYKRLEFILPIVQIMLTVSPSTAECERGFSCMNRLKTQGRTSMAQSTLQNLMRINVEDIDLENFSTKKSVTHWIDSCKGTRHLQGHRLTGPRGPRARVIQSSDSESDQ